MRRREFLALAGCVAAWPKLAHAQQKRPPVIGFLNTASAAPFADYMRAFRAGLDSTGYVEGRNANIEYRWASGDPALLKEMARDLVSRNVNVIVASGGSPAALAAKEASATIPIVFQVGIDPVQLGLVASLSKPGGNVTGATMLATDLISKRVEILRELVPNANSIIALFNPKGPGETVQMRDLKDAAASLRLGVRIVEASAESEIESAFDKMAEAKSDALLIVSDPLYNGLTTQLAKLALRVKLPAIYQTREFSTSGGLLSYGGSFTDAYYQAGVYTGRVLNGESPADLPVHRSTKVELIVNLKTARALAVVVPMTLLGRADEIIE